MPRKKATGERTGPVVEGVPVPPPEVTALMERMMSNPLMRRALQPSPLPPEAKLLFDGLVMVEVTTRLLVHYLREADQVWNERGAPRHEDWPDHADARKREQAEQQEAENESARARAETPAYIIVAHSRWVDVLENLEQTFRGWCERVSQAQEAVDGVAEIMDAGEARPAKKWTIKVGAALHKLAGLFNPVRVGDDGRGLIHKPPMLPRRLPRALVWLAERRIELHTVAERFKPSDKRVEYKPAMFFGKRLAERLRQATLAGRKTKRVRFKFDDGVKLYSVEDARKWWPKLVPGA